MWGCQANMVSPDPDPEYLYKEGDTVRHRTSGEIIGVVLRRIDRDYIDENGVIHQHLYQGRSDEKGVGLGKYPSYLLRGHITGREFEWTQRDPQLFAEYSREIKTKYEEWSRSNA